MPAVLLTEQQQELPADVRDLILAGYTAHHYLCPIANHYYRDGYNADGYDFSGYDRNGYNRAGYNRDGYDRYGYDDEGYNGAGYDRDGNYRHDDYACSGCEDCQPEYDDYGRPEDDGPSLEYYSYTPRLRFRGEKAPYYGMEIEVTTDYPRRLYGIAQEIAGDLIWCKSDSSVDGAEVVTHPMSYDWAMANFPWDMLPAFKDRADATTIASDNGIHIHVSRDGFSDSAHMFRWFKLWYRNPNDIQRLARRRGGNWASFRPDHRAGQKDHVKFGKPGYDYDSDETRRQRYSAINTQNDATLEVRVFASTLRPRRAKAALQLVAGSVEYARQLTSEQIVRRHGWDWAAFIAWASKDGRYPDLIAENRTRRPY